MGTPYENIRNRFFDKIKEDKKFFIYGNLSEDEAKEIMKKRANYLLENAITEIQLNINPYTNLSFLDKDDELEKFNFDLTLVEEDLISDLMVVKYYEEQLAAVNRKQEYVGEQGKAIFSLSRERTTLIDLVNFKYENFKAKLEEYNCRDRLTNKYNNLDIIGIYYDE